MVEDGYCQKCERFYPDAQEAFQKCPENHPLLHHHECSICHKTKMYFQTDDDYCGPEKPLICGSCAIVGRRTD